jgi:hypothetical protein
VVEDAPLARAPVHHGAADELRQLRVAHRRVRAERDQEVERRDPHPQLRLENVEEQGHRHGAGAVGDQHQHALAVERQLREPLARHLLHLVDRQEPDVDSAPDDGRGYRHVGLPVIGLPVIGLPRTASGA